MMSLSRQDHSIVDDLGRGELRWGKVRGPSVARHCNSKVTVERLRQFHEIADAIAVASPFPALLSLVDDGHVFSIDIRTGQKMKLIMKGMSVTGITVHLLVSILFYYLSFQWI